MSNNTIFRLKDHVTIGDLESVGYQVSIKGAIKVLPNGLEVFIPLKSSIFGYRIIQDNQISADPEELNPEYIEDLVERGWVDEIEKPLTEE